MTQETGNAMRQTPQLSPQVQHAIMCHRRLQAAEKRARDANRALNDALARMPDQDEADYVLGTLALGV